MDRRTGIPFSYSPEPLVAIVNKRGEKREGVGEMEKGKEVTKAAPKCTNRPKSEITGRRVCHQF